MELRDTPCIEWIGPRDIEGYGRFAIGKKYWKAHRFVYTMTVGPIPPGHVILHACDNPGCVNPWHLSTGTAAENIADMVAKGRHYMARLRSGAIGEVLHPRVKINREIAAEIRRLYAEGGYTQKTLGEMFGIGQAMVSAILLGKCWPSRSPSTRDRA